MYFAKNEVIELNDKKKYLVLNVAVTEDNVYYKVVGINYDETQKIGDPLYITTFNRQGKIYINNRLSAEDTQKISRLFED